MNLETILWLVVWVVVSEIIFIVWSICHEDNHDYVSLSSSWVFRKIFSFLIGGGFIVIQAGIVFGIVEGTEPNYFRLVYEVIILGVLGILFFLNWLISKKINKSKEKK